MSLSKRAILIAMCLPYSGPLAWSQERRGAQPEAQHWQAAMARVHARFHGRKGTFAHFGDSITVTLAFWTPLHYARKNAPPEMQRAYRIVEGYIRPECWRDWKGPEYGNDGGQTIRWADENLGSWLRKLDPEVALIMFGTNDLVSLERDEYQRKLREVVKRCLDNGTVVILSTIPPRHGLAERAEAFADVARATARELALPLVDYHAEILKRRPADWDGADDAFRQYHDYDVPTLLARDGVHPSAPKQYQDDYSAVALRSSGYGLRNYLALLKYAEVINAISATRPAAKPRDKEPELGASEFDHEE
jgi:hypothetical protein